LLRETLRQRCLPASIDSIDANSEIATLLKASHQILKASNSIIKKANVES